MAKSISKQEKNSPKMEDRKPPSLKIHEDENRVLQIGIDDDFDRILNPETGKAVALGLIG
jgi:hypothetical protein